MMTNLHKQNSQFGFTLAELLVALAILGVIATFTIPKILDSGSDSKFNAITKEAMGTFSGAYQTYKLESGSITSASIAGLTPYMNYVKFDTTSIVDLPPVGGTRNCFDANYYCYVLHNGAILYTFNQNKTFSSTDSTSGISFNIDPDGINTGNDDSIQLWLYPNGLLRTFGTVLPNTYAQGAGPYNPNPASDPSWFSWSN